MILQADEDAIDLQDLQAQIDLSMSFAQNLVTSWVKPTRYSKSDRQKDMEDEIQEYMRRPARLGVGAPIPETQSLAREAAMLKSKLEGGKKRRRGNEDIGAKKFELDDEGESRTGAIKKKVRIDPFNVLSKNGQRKSGEFGEKNGPTMHPAAMRVMSGNAVDVEDRFDMDEIVKELLIVPESPEMLGKKTDKNARDGPNCYEEQRIKPPKCARSSEVKTTAKQLQISASGKYLPPRQSSAASHVAHPKLIDISPATPLLSPVHHTGTGLLKQPLLNLLGSPSEGESGEGERPGPGPTSKNKRKRRRKKKFHQNIEVKSAQI